MRSRPNPKGSKCAVLFLTILFSSCGMSSLFGQSRPLSGKVQDSDSKEGLAFVSVVLKGKGKGVIANMDGQWTLPSVGENDTLLFRLVGYQHKLVPAAILFKSKDVVVLLEPKHLKLQDVVILPGENPAHRIIKLAQDNKKVNDWMEIPKFAARSYNRFHITVEKDTTGELVQAMPGLSISFGTDTTKAGKNKADTLADGSKRSDTLTDSTKKELNEMAEFFRKQYLFMTESVAEVKYKRPGKVSETVLATRTSGFNDPRLGLLSSQYNRFNIYDEQISLSSKFYLSPMANGSTRKYFFQLEDTLWSAAGDTIFVISYRPRTGTKFDGFKGLLYINSNRYAVQNATARPAELTQGPNIRITQEFELLENKYWFPVKVNVDILLTSIGTGAMSLVAIGRSYYSDVDFEPELRRRDFGAAAIKISGDANKKDSAFWALSRVMPLGDKEAETYRVLDSIGKAEKFDQKLKIAEAIATGRLPIGKVDLDLDKILAVNRYENVRIGAGFITNSKLSPYFEASAYGGYGFRDKAFKYGGGLEIIPFPGRFFRFGGRYNHDISEFGGTDFMLDRRMNFEEKVRLLYISQMNTVDNRQAFIRWRMLRYLQTQVSFNYQSVRVNNDYRFVEPGKEPANQFNFTEAGLSFRYAYREKLITAPGFSMPIASRYPIIWMQVLKGLNSYDYTRVDVRVEKTKNWKLLGKTNIQIAGGKVFGQAPMVKNYFAKASLTNKFNVSTANAFETMRMNEFASTEHVDLFLTHSFEKLLYRKGKFRPVLRLHHNMGFGWLEGQDNNTGMEIKPYDKGYYESGFSVNNLLTSTFTGFGVGFYYRYGQYAFPNAWNNLAIKMTLSQSF